MSSSPHTRRHFIRNCASAAALLAASRSALSLPALRSTATFRFGVFSLFQPQRLMLRSNEPLLLSFDDATPALLQAGNPLSIQFAPHHRLTLQWSSRTITISRLCATAASGEAATFALSVPPPALHGSITRSFSGTLELTAASHFLQPVIIMQREAAVACIVHAESPPAAPLAYLAAQAIVSRSFLSAAHTGHSGFDFCDTTHCQFLREAPAAGSPILLALQQTQNLCLVASAEPLAAMYSRSCSGHTHTLAELGLPTCPYPYYSVVCEYCLHHPERWSHSLQSVVLPLSERDRLAYNRIHGWSALPSVSFTANATGVSGRGIGHGIGLCQRGTASMAKSGSSAQQILSHYYPDTALASLPA
jgi:hypothetical protein